MSQLQVNQGPSWLALQQHAIELKRQRLAELVLNDPQRLSSCQVELNGLRFNYALNHVNRQTIDLLIALARQQKLENWRAAMFRGDKINTTEKRAALHIALRQRGQMPLLLDGVDINAEVRQIKQRIADFVGMMRNGEWQGATGAAITDVVHIGIGGSDLGPRLVTEALAPYATGPKIHFVANVDASELLAVLAELNPATTLFVIVSKTFTTQETLVNGNTARQWLVAQLGEAAVSRHFIAVSTNQAAVAAFGIAVDRMFPMPEWAGGRYSLWSAVGISIAMAIGMDHFEALLAGAAAMDAHFAEAPLERNMPVLLGLLGIWDGNFLGANAYAILPYSERLRELPRFLQQLEMESNGKSITRDGQPVGIATAPVIFGDCGTVGQHSFHQWLHQGTQSLPADFIGIVEDQFDRPEHHQALLANLAAQAGALAFGQLQAASPADIYPGNRPSNLILLERLDPQRLGMLLALYEHKVFVQGIIWGINSFDQPGVELGKRMAKGLGGATALQKNPQSDFMTGFYSYITGRSMQG